MGDDVLLYLLWLRDVSVCLCVCGPHHITGVENEERSLPPRPLILLLGGIHQELDNERRRGEMAPPDIATYTTLILCV